MSQRNKNVYVIELELKVLEHKKFRDANPAYVDGKKCFYVGMTGKFKRVSKDKVIFNSGTFDKRKGRWTPYRFCESVKDGEKTKEETIDPTRARSNQRRKIGRNNRLNC